jgi:HEAT repeat protein
LTKTENEAALRLLLSALDCPHPPIQEGAMVALLNRRSPAGGREILRRLPTMPPQWKAIIRQHHGRITGALRDAVLSRDETTCRNGCQAAVWVREYDLIPTLLTVLQDANSPHADLAAKTLLELLEELYDELAGTRDRSDRRDPQLIRRFVVGALEPAMQRFGQHKRAEVIEAFLLLVGRDNVTLKQILQSPLHKAFAATIETLSHSPRKGVIRLLLSLLDDPHVPAAALAVIAGRQDARFVQYLLRKIGREPAPTVAQNLKRIDSVAWLQSGERPWESWDDAAQHAVVRLVMASGIPRPQALAVIEDLLQCGKAGGRREAARALAEFHGAQANALALKALEDRDPQVQAHIVSQLRSRCIPGVLPGLVEMVDSPHAVVRKAARESLAEFSFRRFLGTFDMLDEEVRQSTGMLVKKIDPQTVPQLKLEMCSLMRTRRLRAVVIARLIEAVEPLEETIIGLLEDGDHMVRMEAAAALGIARSEASRQALERAAGDRSEVVRQAAQRSLEERLARRTPPAPPKDRPE